MSGYVEPDCKVPCLQTYVNVQDGPEQKSISNNSLLYFSFNQNITKELVTVDTFDFMEALNYLGSNLGLWPGLGLFQLLELAVLIFTSYKMTKANR